MKRERLYTTREVAEMWNVSASTIKRWADSGALKCRRTPGGHRKFSLREITQFQKKQGFVAAGMLSTENWERPEIEKAVNEKNLKLLRREILRLAVQNQRSKVRRLLERLHIRGLSLPQIYDQVVFPILKLSDKAPADIGDLSSGHRRLLHTNLDDALNYLFPSLTRRKSNDKMALVASLDGPNRLRVNAMAHVLEIEGWDVYNVGDQVTFEMLAELVGKEPIDLVCVCSLSVNKLDHTVGSYEALLEVTRAYRIPVVLAGAGFRRKKVRKHFSNATFVKTFGAFRRQAAKRD